MTDILVLATWKFGEVAANTAIPILARNGGAVEAAVAAAQAVEDDPAVNSVGFNGLGDTAGNVTLDACVMDGANLNCGGVAGVMNILHVAALAKRVMEKTPHCLLVGDGAQQFALQQGFPLEFLSSQKSLGEWQKVRVKPGAGPQTLPDPTQGHDTVTVLCRDRHGHLGGACSTSGLAHKLPGRVGDSPIIGSGLYVDDLAGAAGGTGVGEEIYRIAAASLMVEAMRRGMSAQDACELAVKRVNSVADRRKMAVARTAFLAIDKHGGYGGACTVSTDFYYAVGTKNGVEIVKSPIVEERE